MLVPDAYVFQNVFFDIMSAFVFFLTRIRLPFLLLLFLLPSLYFHLLLRSSCSSVSSSFLSVQSVYQSCYLSSHYVSVPPLLSISFPLRPSLPSLSNCFSCFLSALTVYQCWYLSGYNVSVSCGPLNVSARRLCVSECVL